ncbi:hypothetical protein [Arthrobacter sp. ISL-72]|uniref:hypothetical protein n=1 Tax=Arthrobacter sp. ISL-72 TaxID=2819114 RepID=UPI001BE812E3|nr:hypothetical protein [Arthrobacter sp. ISL-72]MBT2597887.1 hypothetical protein [Arthrobacter sp. ISL-72]
MSASMQTRSGFAAFDRTTSIWGPITLGLGMLISLVAALYAAFGTGLGITDIELWKAVGAVVATFGLFAIVEPVSYFPILGRSAMYQAFLIGNIANKLLPAAIVAQAKLNEKPGSRRAELIAGSAIIGAVLVHVTTLLVFVGILGTWIVGILPLAMIGVARLYILPAIFGAVVLQSVLALKSIRTTVVAVVIAALIVFLGIPLAPGITFFATAMAVILTIIVAWLTRSKTQTTSGSDTPVTAVPH